VSASYDNDDDDDELFPNNNSNNNNNNNNNNNGNDDDSDVLSGGVDTRVDPSSAYGGGGVRGGGETSTVGDYVIDQETLRRREENARIGKFHFFYFFALECVCFCVFLTHSASICLFVNCFNIECGRRTLALVISITFAYANH
jgi:hypothetical protein